MLHAHGETATPTGNLYVRWTYPKCPIVRLLLSDCTNPEVVRAKLVERGLPIHGKEGRDRIISELSDLHSYPDTPLAEAPGWSGPAYVLRDGQIILPSGADPVIPAFRVSPRATANVGSVRDWKRKVAKPLVGQDLPIFAISLALSIPLFPIVGIARGIIVELVGPPSTGKTMIQNLTAGVFNAPDGEILAFRELTPSGGSDLSLASDTLLLVDDPQALLAGQTSSRIGTAVRDIIMQLSEGRYNRHPGGSTAGTLIAARQSLVEQVGADTAVGKLIRDRLITLRISDGSDFGAFNTIPQQYCSSAGFCDAVAGAARTYYGSIGKQFVQRLVQDLADNETDLISDIQDSIKSFRERAKIGIVSGYNPRDMEAFGVVYAAAVLARRYKIFPKNWRFGTNILACLDRHLRGNEPDTPFVDQLVSIANGSDVVFIDADIPSNCATIKRSEVYVTNRKGRRELLIRPEALSKLLPAWRGNQPPPGLLDFIVKEKGHFTVQRRLRKGMRLRLHAFRLPSENAD
nr:DUF927 domain-containing protein [Sphingomonas montana]